MIVGELAADPQVRGDIGRPDRLLLPHQGQDAGTARRLGPVCLEDGVPVRALFPVHVIAASSVDPLLPDTVPSHQDVQMVPGFTDAHPDGPNDGSEVVPGDGYQVGQNPRAGGMVHRRDGGTRSHGRQRYDGKEGEQDQDRKQAEIPTGPNGSPRRPP